VAKPTRAERRARRLAGRQEPVAAGAGAEAPARLAPPPRPERHGERGVPGGGAVRFVREAVGELRKVEWPSQNHVVQGTIVVLIACVIVGAYLYVADQVFRRFVENVLLGQ
jgi:preprotein translocase SecE subunit